MQFGNIVITGACGGLGQALARKLIRSGARVGLLGLNAERLAELQALAPERVAVYTPDISAVAAMTAVAMD